MIVCDNFLSRSHLCLHEKISSILIVAYWYVGDVFTSFVILKISEMVNVSVLSFFFHILFNSKG